MLLLNTQNKTAVNQRPEKIVEQALGLSSKAILTTSFGTYSAALIDAAWRVNPKIQVVWCDTGFNTKATYTHAIDLIEKYGLNIEIFTPAYTSGYIESKIGMPDVTSPLHDEFSRIVKLDPFQRALDKFKPDVWLTNIRQGQSDHRDKLDVYSRTAEGRIKVSPFYHFSDTKLEAYMEARNLPILRDYHDPVKALSQRECGIHFKG